MINKIREEKDIYNNVEMPIFYRIHSKGKGNIEMTHYHSYIEIIYILDGGSDVYVGDNIYQLKKGDMIIINSGVPHESCATDKKTDELVVKFEPDTLYMSDGYAYNFMYIMPVMYGMKNKDCIFRNSETENTYVPHALKNGAKECMRGEYGFEFAMKAELLRVFLWIVRSWKNKGIISSEFETHIDVLKPALEYAQNEYADADSSVAAKKCSLSYAYFSKLFKKTFSQSFSEYVNNIRVSESKRLLIGTDKSITEIAMDTGFSTTSYYISVFKKITGETPYRFRKHMYGK